MEPSPYDNVEFGPVGRKSGTGTWPGPQGPSSTTTTTTQQASRFSPQQQLLQAKDRTGLVGAKLEPLEETVETAESHDQRMQAVKQQASSIVPSSSSSQSSYFHRGGTGVGVGGGTVAGGGSDGGGVKTVNNVLLSMSAAPTSSTSSSVKPSSPSTATTTMSSALKTTTNAVAGSGAAEQPKSSSNAVNAPTYVLTQVGEVKDKTVVRGNDDDDEFKRHDLDPPSRAALETAYKMQKDFYRLNSRILDEGTLLKQDVMDIYRKAGETFSYEQLLQGMLEDGEMLLLGGCWLHYMHVEFKDETGERTVRQPYGKGRLCLTNNRVLLLSAEIYSDASLEPYGDPQKKGGYKLEVSKRNAIIFRNIPLSCFYSAELEVNVGTSAQTKITARRRPCCGLCCLSACTFCFSSWTSTPPMTRSFNERVVRMGVALPPWGTHGFIVVHLDPGQSLTTARDFVAQLHQHSPHMH